MTQHANVQQFVVGLIVFGAAAFIIGFLFLPLLAT